MTEEPILAEVVEDDEVKALAARPQSSLAMQDEWSVDQLVAQMQKIQEAMKVAMKDGEHYGVIPGTQKPTLLKPGAEKLCVMFRLGPKYRTDKTFHENGHLTVTAICALQHIPTGNFVAEGEGLCSTMEAKYAYRQGQRLCPHCGKPAIIKGKKEYGGGWLCFKKKDGCGAKFDDNDQSITSQNTERVDYPDLADSYNTVLKMACKRALIAACLNGTAASDIFTQDLEVEDRGQSDPQPEPNAAPSAQGVPSSSSPAAASAPGSSAPSRWFDSVLAEFGEDKLRDIAAKFSLSQKRPTLKQLEAALPEQQRDVLAELDFERGAKAGAK